jgi:cytochrome c oxidase subunit 2
MAFLVIAEPAEAYARWAEQQHRPAREPQADAERRGRDVFLSRSCMLCHAIEGTPANARRAPDLTHIAGRRTLAAGTLPNEPEKLAQWILDPQSVKPGTTMPATELSSDELQGLVAYLRSLE